MTNLTSIIFHYCLNIFKFLDEKFGYEVIDGRKVTWLKIKYEDEEFIYSYSDADYLYFGSATYGYNGAQVYIDIMKDIGQVFTALGKDKNEL